jgi:membrane-associated phospholipid phosphatase
MIFAMQFKTMNPMKIIVRLQVVALLLFLALPMGAQEAVNTVPQARSTYVDDALQFVPVAAVYGLDLCGVKARHGVGRQTVTLLMGEVISEAVTQGLKTVVDERRPDKTDLDAFPSGHAARAFLGAEALYQEFKEVSPWIGVAGYAVAATTGYLRVRHDRHYTHDVVAGAVVGVASCKLAYWLYPKLFRSSKGEVAWMASPYCSTQGAGLCGCLIF